MSHDAWDAERIESREADRLASLRLVTLLSICLGAMLGLLAYALTFPLDAVFADADRFGFEPDQQAHIAAIRYFAWDEWRWPLFLAKPLGAPEGTIIVFSDGLPLFALAVRFLRDLLFWPDSNFLALWLAICYALQGAAAVAALRMAGVERLSILLLGALLALATPSFILRFGHTALCTQGLILLALGLYFYGRRTGDATRALLWCLVLCWLTLLVNAYLFVMVSALFGALWLASLTDRSLPLLRAVLLLVLLVGWSLLIMWAGGYLADHGAGSGFGHYSWNPLSLVVPQQSFFFPEQPMVDATGGQYEGFSYLGFGLMLALLASLVAARRRLGRVLRRHWALLLSLLLLLALALSQKVWLGGWLLLDLGEPPALLGALRSSGRMVWVLIYVLMLSVLLTLPRLWGRAGIVVLLVCVVLQVVDSHSYRRDLTRRVAEAPPRALPAEAWRPVVAGKATVEVLPDFRCARKDRDRALVNLAVYQTSAALVPVTTVYSARPAPKNCSTRPAESLFFRELEPDRVVVVMGRQDNMVKLMVSSLGIRRAGELCRVFRFGVACGHDWPDLATVDGFFQPQALTASELFPAIRLGTSFKPSLEGEVAAIMGPGWGVSQQGTWTLNGVGYFVLRPERLPPEGLQLTVEAVLPALPGAETQDLWITINGEERGRWQQAPSDEAFRADLRFAAAHATSDGLLLIGLHNAKPVPSGNGRSLLGLRVERVTIGPLP